MFSELLKFSSFTTENERDNRMPSLGVNIILSARQIYNLCSFNPCIFNRKPAFSGIHTHFDSFAPSTYKIRMIHTLLYRCLRICSDWTKIHLELVKLMGVFTRNGYAENFINNCFNIQEKEISVPENTLFLVLPNLEPSMKISQRYSQLLQTTDCV